MIERKQPSTTICNNQNFNTDTPKKKRNFFTFHTENDRPQLTDIIRFNTSISPSD